MTPRRAPRPDAVEITRPDKVLIPPGVSKAALAAYYEAVAQAMLSHIADRPLNLERYPDGIGGEKIMQQRIGRYFPDWISRVEVPAAKGTVKHVVANDAATLVYLAGQACITLHPWLSRRDKLQTPDRLVIDLDPSRDDAASVRGAALVIGHLLRELGLRPWVMTSGSRGYHVVVPLQRRLDFDAVRDFSRGVADLAAGREPEMFTTEQRKAKREGKILIDVMRNAYAHTSVAPYAVRARPGGPVATPLAWAEVEEDGMHPQRFTVASVPERIARDGDPWREMKRSKVSLTAARKRLDEALAEMRGKAPKS
jgi:bifunctional non-homologous end joining protein LigD